jgi:hypothetical protein
LLLVLASPGTITMRAALLALLALASVIPSVGCVGARGACGACQHCDQSGSACVRNGFFARHVGPNNHYTDPAAEGAGAPSSAQVGYPYYTNRGPRDFLMPDPPSIGN